MMTGLLRIRIFEVGAYFRLISSSSRFEKSVGIASGIGRDQFQNFHHSSRGYQYQCPVRKTNEEIKKDVENSGIA
jgi:hypothetical protein